MTGVLIKGGGVRAQRKDSVTRQREGPAIYRPRGEAWDSFFPHSHGRKLLSTP